MGAHRELGARLLLGGCPGMAGFIPLSVQMPCSKSFTRLETGGEVVLYNALSHLLLECSAAITKLQIFLLGHRMEINGHF